MPVTGARTSLYSACEHPADVNVNVNTGTNILAEEARRYGLRSGKNANNSYKVGLAHAARCNAESSEFSRIARCEDMVDVDRWAFSQSLKKNFTLKMRKYLPKGSTYGKQKLREFCSRFQA